MSETPNIDRFEKTDEQLRAFMQQNRGIFERFNLLVEERNKLLDPAKAEVLEIGRSKGQFKFAPRRSREYDVAVLKKELTLPLFKQVTVTSVDLKSFDAAVKKGAITEVQVMAATLRDEKKPSVSGPKPIFLGDLL